MAEAIQRLLAQGEARGASYALALPRNILAGRAGNLLGKNTGSSLDFKDFREYAPGDDIRHIDWNAYGRSDKLIIKQFREEVNPHADIIIDSSRSMNTGGPEKAHMLFTLAGFFTACAINAKCTVTAWAAGEGCVKAGSGLTESWGDIQPDAPFSLPESFAAMPPVMPKKGIRIVLSDLLFPGTPESLIYHLSENAAAVHIIQILSQQDTQPPPTGGLRVVDSETGEELHVHMNESTAQEYTDALTAHQEMWFSACRKTGARLSTIIADAQTLNAPETVFEKSGIITVPMKAGF